MSERTTSPALCKMNTSTTTAPCTIEELDLIVKRINARVITAQHKHVEETIDQLERRLKDIRWSLEYAKRDGKECEIECNLKNIINAATTGLATAPKTVGELDVFLAVSGR